ALEAATGIDVIVDETPEAVVLSGFDPVRREVAKVALERLFVDGRIHPARIEEVVAKSRSEIADRLREEGEAAIQEMGITGVHPELVKLLGTLRYRSWYGANVLVHSKDTALVAGLIAAEIGYDVQEAREIGLFHDIGHAVEQHVEGSHAIIGGEILARLGRPAAVVHAVRAHHYDEEPRSIGAFVLMTADALTASRRGARRGARRLDQAAGAAGADRRPAARCRAQLRHPGRQGAAGDGPAGGGRRRPGADHGARDRQAASRGGELLGPHQGGRAGGDPERRIRQVTVDATATTSDPS